MALLDFLNSLSIPKSDPGINPGISQSPIQIPNGNTNTFGSALQQLAKMDQAYRNDQHMQKVYAANPRFADALYGRRAADEELQQKRQSALLQLKRLTSGQDKPAALQLAEAVLAAEQRGDSKTANAIREFAKTQDRGVMITPEGNAVAVPQYGTALGEIGAARKGMERQAEKDVDAVMNPQIAGGEAAAKLGVEIGGASKLASEGAKGKVAGEAEGANLRKEIQAPQIDSLIAEAESILPNASSGVVGSLATGAAKIAGKSTDASKADARLKVISAALTGNVPRFEGPQGVLDVELYKQAAADVANSNLPYEDRLAALDTMRTLNNKYLPKDSPAAPVSLATDKQMQDMPPADQHNGRTITDTATKKRYKSDGKKWNPI